MRTPPWTSGSVADLSQASNALGEVTDALVTTRNVRVERIISHGETSASGFWYDQTEDEFVLLLSGEARLEFQNGESLELRANDWVNIPAHVLHRVAWTALDVPTIWLAVFTSPAD